MPLNEVFIVTDDQLREQVSQLTSWFSTHCLPLDDQASVITTDGPRSLQQVAWYLAHNQWVDHVYTTCGEKNCLTTSHLTDDKAKVEQAQAERDLALIQRSTVSLADLYRRGKARGLLTSMSKYH